MMWHILTVICGILCVLAAMFPDSYSHLFAGDWRSLIVFFAAAVVLFSSLALGTYRDWF